MGLDNLPVERGRKLVAAFERAGWVHVRTKGSHAVLKKDGMPHLVTIPCTKETVKRKLLAGQINRAGMTEEEFLDFYHRRRRRGRRASGVG